MKAKNSVKLSLILFVILNGCPGGEGPYHVLTRVKSDASCRRELIRTADSAFVIKGDTSHNPFPMKLDSTWKISIYKRIISEDGDTSRFANWPIGKYYETDSVTFSWYAIAARDYESVDELAESFRFDNSQWSQINPVNDLNKKFRWFYTYYEFSETYPHTNPFKIVPITDYMSDIEIAALYGEDKEFYRGKNGFEVLQELKSLEEKSEKWLEHNLYEEIYRVYLENYDHFKDAPVDSHEFAMEKDTIFKYYIKTDSADFDDLDDMINHHFHTTAYSTDADFDNLLEVKLGEVLQFDVMELNYKLLLPGKVIETNAPFITGDTLSWKVDQNRFYFRDLTLEAISRRPNLWAFLATVMIVLAAISGFLIKRRPV